MRNKFLFVIMAMLTVSRVKASQLPFQELADNYKKGSRVELQEVTNVYYVGRCYYNPQTIAAAILENRATSADMGGAVVQSTDPLFRGTTKLSFDITFHPLPRAPREINTPEDLARACLGPVQPEKVREDVWDNLPPEEVANRKEYLIRDAKGFNYCNPMYVADYQGLDLVSSFIHYNEKYSLRKYQDYIVAKVTAIKPFKDIPAGYNLAMCYYFKKY